MNEIKDFLKNNKTKEFNKIKLKSMISKDNAVFHVDDKEQFFEYLYDQNPTLAATVAQTTFIPFDAVNPILKAFESDVELYQVPNSRMLRGYGYQTVLDNAFFIDIKTHGYLAITDSNDVFFCSGLQDKIQHLNYYLTDQEVQSFIADVQSFGKRVEGIEPFLSKELIERSHIVRTEVIQPEAIGYPDEEHRVEVDMYLPLFPTPNMRLDIEVVGTQSEYSVLFRGDNIKAFGFTALEQEEFVELLNQSHDQVIDTIVDELREELFDDLPLYTIEDLSKMDFKLVEHTIEDKGYADTSTRHAGLYMNDELAISLKFLGEVEIEKEADLLMHINATEFVVENPYRLGLDNDQAVAIISEHFASNINTITSQNNLDLNELEAKRVRKGFKYH